MKIVSPFHDYYDIATFYSPTPMYIRQTQEFDLTHPENNKTLAPHWALDLREMMNHAPSITVNNFRIGDDPTSVQSIQKFLVGFCGRLYVGYQIDMNSYKVVHYRYGIPKLLEDFPYCKRASTPEWDEKLLKDWERFYQNYKALLENKDVTNFVESGIPVFAILPFERSWGHRCIFQLNPRLRDLGFVSQFDPYMAYQEIEMFVGGVLSNTEDASLERTDEAVAESKGFDRKWSFRRHPEDSKKPRRRGRG
jgi:hypothetical protein